MSYATNDLDDVRIYYEFAGEKHASTIACADKVFPDVLNVLAHVTADGPLAA